MSPLTDDTLRSLLLLLRHASQDHGFDGWGEDPIYGEHRVAVPIEEGWVTRAVCPGGQFASDPAYDLSHHHWNVEIVCPVRASKVVAELRCMVEIAVRGAEARGRMVGLVRDVETGEGTCWAPITEWYAFPSLSERSPRRWEGVLLSMDEVVADAYSALMDEKLTFITVPVEPRKGPVVDPSECPCDTCQEHMAYLHVSGGAAGGVAVDARILDLNAKLQRANPDLTFCLHIDVQSVEDNLPLLGVPSAIATCESVTDGSLLWAMGGETAQEALDGIEAWAWALLVTDLAARKGLGRGEG